MMTHDRRNMEMSDFLQITNYLKQNNEDHVGIIGGEPTLHPQIVSCITSLLEKDFKVQLFTNGLVPAGVVKKLAQLDKDQLRILVNVNDRSFYSRSRLAHLESTLHLFGDNAVLGYTLFTPDVDLSFHAELIKRHDLGRGLRLGLASPIVGHPSGDVSFTKNFETLGARIVENIVRLEKDDILLNFDCGFTMCMFTAAELGIITQKTKGFTSVCNPVLDIDIDLNIHHCFPLTNVLSVPMARFPNLEALKKTYEKLFRSIKIFGKQGNCLECKYLKRHQCSGWCLGHILNSNEGLLEKINTAGRKALFAPAEKGADA